MTQAPTAKQRLFLCLDDLEVYYGGAAGGAKSSGLLLAGLQYVDDPQYAALIVRKNFSQLSKPGALIPRSKELLGGTDAVYNEGRHEWRFPSGATLTFGHIATAASIADYQSAEVQFIGIDEVTDFTEDLYTFLFSRLRRLEGSTVPIRMRSASNPVGPGMPWVKRRFVDPATREPGAVFLPSYLWDNPHLDHDEYVQSLRRLHPILWRRLLHGDWEVTDVGEVFQPRLWLADGGILDAPPTGKHYRVRYWDLASTAPSMANPDPDWTVGVRMARNATTGQYVVEHVVRARVTSGEVRKLVRATARTDPPGTYVGVEQDPGQAGKDQVEDYKRSVLHGYRMLDDTRPTGDKVTRASRFAGAMENGRVVVVAGTWTDAYFDELEGFPAGAHDDQVDASSGAYKALRYLSTRRAGTGGPTAGPLVRR
jgi:predicted phage terminase large subunit-like protein